MLTVGVLALMASAASAQAIPNHGFGIITDTPWEETPYHQSSFTIGEVVSNPHSFFHAYSDPILQEQSAEKFAHLHNFFGQGCIHPFSNSHQMFQCPNCCEPSLGSDAPWENTQSCIGECLPGQDPLVDRCYLKQCTGWQLANNQTSTCMDYADPNDPNDTSRTRVCDWDANRDLIPGQDCVRLCNTNEDPSTDNCIFTGCADSYPPGNKSPYWIPSMIDLNKCEEGVEAGELLDRCAPDAFLEPFNVISYYHVNGIVNPSADPDQVAKFPPGLKILAGSAATTNQEGRARFHCQGPCGPYQEGIGPLAAVHQQAGGVAEIIGTLDFPQCWDGINLDSADHRSHVAYMGSGDGPGCPASHPVPIPALIQLFRWVIPAEARPILSSDMTLEGALPGDTWHGDNIHVQWDLPEVPGDAFETLIENCIRFPTVCTGIRGRGRPEEQIQGMPTPQQPCWSAPFLESELFIDEEGFERERFPALVSSGRIFDDYVFHLNNEEGPNSKCNVGADGNGLGGQGWWGLSDPEERGFKLACPGNSLSVCLGTCDYYEGIADDCIERCNNAC